MNNAQSSFPFFLRLPENAKRNVVSMMKIIDFINLSVLSKSTKVLVKSSGWKNDDFEVSIDQECGGDIDFYYDGFEFTFYSTNNEQTNFMNYNGLRIDGRPWTSKTVKNFTIGHWLKHFLFIFNSDGIKLRIFSNTGDLESIRNAFHGITFKCLVFEDIGQEYTENVLQKLSFTKKFIHWGRLGHAVYSKMAIQNMEEFVSKATQGATLNDILLNNSECLEIEGAILSPKELNHFLKLWAKNFSNPRMKFVFIYLSKNVKRDNIETVEKEVMKGFNRQVIPRQKILQAYPFPYKYLPRIIPTDGFVISRKDGASAAVQLHIDECVLFAMTLLS